MEGPSGVGKDSYMQELIKQFPNKFQKITSYTSREIRPGEIDGVTYNFVDKKTFEDKLKTGDIFEFTDRHGTYRGMGKSLIDDIIENGKIAVKDLDLVGINALKKVYPNQVLTIFCNADRDVVKSRLLKRGGSMEDIEKRLVDYDKKILEQDKFDYVVIDNKCVETAVEKLLAIFKKENIL